jgi:hypothetical protein
MKKPIIPVPKTTPEPPTLTSMPKLNPSLMDAFTSGLGSIKKASVGGIPWYVYVIAILLLVLVFVFLYRVYWKIETVGNIRYGLRGIVKKFSIYGDQRISRKGLIQYLNDLKSQGVPDSHFALTNFFVCSANTPCIFTPLTDGFVSPDAIRLNLAAGARYLDIPISRSGKQDGYAPIVCEMQPGSNWRRITMNQLSFQTVMDTIVEYGLSGHKTNSVSIEAPYLNDPLFIMLRFNGKPKQETFTEVANILGKTIESHRLDFIYYNGRGMETLFKTPITQYMGKVIIMSNMYPPRGNPLGDYINIGPRGSTPLEMMPGAVMSIPDQNMQQYKLRIQQNLTVVRQPMEEPNCNMNGWNWTKAHFLGVHFAALNFWSDDDNLKAYRAPAVFGVNSFLLKPADLRYVIEYVAPPAEPSKELDARDGKPRAPTGLIMPE